jgi:hypothetical protein
MNSRFEDGQKDNNPLCRFGPGGDYIAEWKAENEFGEGNALSKVLEALGSIVAMMAGVEPRGIQSHKTNLNGGQLQDNGHTSGFKFKLHNFKSGKINAKANSNTKVGKMLPGEQMLFADDSGAVKDTGYKPKHSIRTYHGASKKRTNDWNFGQGSLFDDKHRSARTA